MITRKYYLDQIRPFIDKPIIKAIIGIRRCGKSTVLIQIMDELREKSVADSQIIYINKELLEFDYLQNYTDLHTYIKDKSTGNVKSYVFIDEVQEIEQWERAVNSLLAEKSYDLFITGSNSRLLSSELATLLAGRYIEFKMGTFSYNEFATISGLGKAFKDEDEMFNAYLKFGGFPGLFGMDRNETVLIQYLQAIYSTVLLKDVVSRYQIRDVGMLQKIIHFVTDNLGNITTAKNISEFVKSQNRRVSVETVQNYLQYTMNALIIQQVRRFDIKGKRILETHEKYFLSDLGLRLVTTPFSPETLPGQLENVVFLELLKRGYHINIGKVYDKEIDFIAQKGDSKVYIQVCTTLADGKVVDSEYGALEGVNDHFPKLVLSLDIGFDTSRKGIGWMNIKDFLLDK